MKNSFESSNFISRPYGQSNSRHDLRDLDNYRQNPSENFKNLFEKQKEKAKQKENEEDLKIIINPREETKKQISPQNITRNFAQYKTIFSPEPRKNYYLAFYLFASAIFTFYLFYINVYPEFFFWISMSLFLLTFIAAIAKYMRMRPPNIARPIYNNKIQSSDNSLNIPPPFQQNRTPHEMFLKKRKTDQNNNVPIPAAQLASHHTYVISDRPTASYHFAQTTDSDEMNIDQLATEAIRKLGMSSSIFNQYLVNMKAFLQKAMLKKLVPQMHKSDPIIESMLNVPNYEHQRSYIIERIKTLADAEFLAGHCADRGQRWNDREWTNELPSDNQIILHILSVWLSSLMNGPKDSKKFRPVFKNRYLYIGLNPIIKSDDEILLCSKDWANFYVHARFKSDQAEDFYAFPGHDSMYSAITIFFFIIKETKKFILEGCDLTDSPFFMNRVYSVNERFV